MSDRGSLISGNWKMNHTHFEAIRYVQRLAALLRARPLPEGRAVSVHPTFTSLRSVQTALESDRVPVLLGAQDCHEADEGAYTGAVSGKMLAKLNVSHVIVGHSERRHAGESDETVRAKVDAVLRNLMTPILCVGETFEERRAGVALEKVAGQLHAALDGCTPDVVASLVVAYEPIWAIGTGDTASADDAEEMAAHIRREVGLIAGSDAAAALKVQYGGSVTSENAGTYLRRRGVDGLLVGGASLEADTFYEIAAVH